MNGNTDFSEALKAMATLRGLLEPGGGAIAWRDQPPARVQEFLRAAANTHWLFGIACEDIITAVGIKMPRSGVEI